MGFLTVTVATERKKTTTRYSPQAWLAVEEVVETPVPGSEVFEDEVTDDQSDNWPAWRRSGVGDE